MSPPNRLAAISSSHTQPAMPQRTAVRVVVTVVGTRVPQLHAGTLKCRVGAVPRPCTLSDCSPTLVDCSNLVHCAAVAARLPVPSHYVVDGLLSLSNAPPPVVTGASRATTET